jgi:hypothetical protein
VGGVLFYHVFENTKPIPVPKYVLVYVKRRMEELSKAFGRAALEGSVATAMAYSQLMDWKFRQMAIYSMIITGVSLSSLYFKASISNDFMATTLTRGLY